MNGYKSARVFISKGQELGRIEQLGQKNSMDEEKHLLKPT